MPSEKDAGITSLRLRARIGGGLQGVKLLPFLDGGKSTMSKTVRQAFQGVPR